MIAVENFYLEKENVFIERWFDRCIDRNDDYIPTFPYWTNTYSAEDWIKEGTLLVLKSHEELIEKIKKECTNKGIEIEYISFAEDLSLMPQEETGFKVYSKAQFLDIDHKEVAYEGYVYYGVSKVKFLNKCDREAVKDLVHFIINGEDQNERQVIEMNDKELEEFIENITGEQAEKVMIEFDNCYNDDDVDFTEKGEILAQLYADATWNEKALINKVLSNLCGYNLKSLVERSKE